MCLKIKYIVYPKQFSYLFQPFAIGFEQSNLFQHIFIGSCHLLNIFRHLTMVFISVSNYFTIFSIGFHQFSDLSHYLQLVLNNFPTYCKKVLHHWFQAIVQSISAFSHGFSAVVSQSSPYRGVKFRVRNYRVESASQCSVWNLPFFCCPDPNRPRSNQYPLTIRFSFFSIQFHSFWHRFSSVFPPVCSQPGSDRLPYDFFFL